MKNKRFSENFWIIFSSLFLFISGAFIFWVSSLKIPDLNSFNERVVSQSTKIYDRTGEILLYDIHQNTRRTVVPYENISRHLKNATVAIEDADFYQHKGVKPTAFLRALIVNLMSADFTQGGSTITQQVIKNSLLTKEKKISRKIKEWILAMELEKKLTKEEILEIYLNESPYGGNIYGAEEAGLAFFGKKADKLTLVESAYLAAIPKAPTYYSPYGENKEKLEQRKNLVLLKMLENKFIDKKEYENALKEKVVFKNKSDFGIKAPHFVFYIKEYLEGKYGSDVIENGGLKVTTTIDYDLQQKAEEIVKKYALSNKTQFNAENAALVAVETQTGQILSMVGSRDYFDKEIDGNFNVATSHRQPGSAFKPFVYATAFNKGYTPDTVVFDLPTEFSTYCNAEGQPFSPQNKDKCYSPENYDNKYRGPVTFRDALAQSLNVPAVKILYLAGIKDSLKTAKDMGINSLTETSRYGLTLVLGGGEVSLLDITGAYAVFANEGVKNPTTGILKIENKEGKILEEFIQKKQVVLPELSALYISNILSDNKARTPAFGSDSPLYFPNRDVAGKTGTTNDYKDAWTVGYIKQVAVGVWAGNNNNTSMEKKVAGYIVTPMWNSFMQEVLKKYPDEKFKKPSFDYSENIKPIIRGKWQGGDSYFIDKISGKLATEYTPKETKIEKVKTNYHSILYWIDKNDPLGPKPSNPYNDPQFSNWESSVQKWVTKNGFYNNDYMPSEYDNIHTPNSVPKIKILNPTETNIYKTNEKINIIISNNSYNSYPLIKLNYYLNNQLIGTSNSTIFSFIPNDFENLMENNELKVVGFDSVMNKGETIINIKFDL